MKLNIKISYLFLLTISMVLLTMSKIYVLYVNTSMPQHIFTTFLRTTALLAVIYIVLNYLLFRKVLAVSVVIHELLALIILADLMYYKYFEAFPSFHEVSMLPEAFAAKESVKELFKPVYLLLFADAPLIWAVRLKLGEKLTQLHCKIKYPALIALVLAFITVFDCAAMTQDSFGAYNNSGLLHFHSKQVGEILRQGEDPMIEVEEEDTMYMKKLEKVVKKYKSTPKYFGIAKDRNVIVVQVEALQQFVIGMNYGGQEVTPNINKLLKKDTIYYDNYHQNTGKGNTSDAEFVSLNSLYPTITEPSYSKYANTKLYGLPKILKDLGYSTGAYHGYKAEFWRRNEIYPLAGFDHFESLETLKQDEIIGWGISDKSFFKQVTADFTKSQQPFFGFLITLTSHHPFKLPSQYNTLKLKQEHKNHIIGNYLQSVRYADAAIGVFIEELKKEGLYDNCIIAIYGDHQAITAADEENKKLMSELLGYEYDVEEMTNVPLIIHIPNSNIAKTNSIVSGQLDLMPTMLNLLGIDKGNIRFYGQDINNAEKGLASAQYMVPKGTFMDDEKVYLAARNGVFEHGKAWDRKTKKPIDLNLCREGYDRVIKAMKECEYLLTKDILFEDNIEIGQ